MSKSIASMTLTTVKRREEERLEEARRKFLEIMQKEFDDRVRQINPWTAVGEGSYYTFPEGQFAKAGKKDIVGVATDVGFQCKLDGWSIRTVKLGIPKWVTGEKKTPAQLMLYWSNIKINRRIKEETAQAKEACKRVLGKIKKGDFKSTKCHGYYEIEVEEKHPDSSQVFMKEAEKYMEARKFKQLKIDANKGIWVISLEDTES